MFTNVSRLAVGAVIATTLAGCVAPPPRHSTVYYDDRGGYYERDCRQCGRITDIERVYARGRGETTGGGAVIGAIVGGLLGSTVGKGDGRTAATVAGAVAGGFAGNAVERDSNGRSYNAYRFYVSLDDGRSAVVTQYDNPGFRPGDRVAIQRDHLVMMR